MGNFMKAFKKLKSRKIEFSNCYNTLHINKGEDNITFYGIYRKRHPKWEGWKIVDSILRNSNSIEEASIKLCKNGSLISKVKEFYKEKFWDPLKGDYIPQTIAEEMFVFYIHTGRKKTAIKMAQKASGMPKGEIDGIIGIKTITHFNSMSQEQLNMFSEVYDKYEKSFYIRLVKKVSRLKWALRGFLNRAVKV